MLVDADVRSAVVLVEPGGAVVVVAVALKLSCGSGAGSALTVGDKVGVGGAVGAACISLLRALGRSVTFTATTQATTVTGD